MSDSDTNKAAFDSRDFSAIFDHASIGVRDIKRAMAFYEPTLATLGLEIVMDKGFAVAFGNGSGRQWLWISEPIDKKAVVIANNGAHFALIADSRSTVRAFHAAAMANGGREDGAPGLRPEYIPTYYGTFVLDPDGNKVEAVCRRPEDD
ncbi:MAG: VOC family protein [Rhodospirillaceae bacterium]|jgi:catechol 2,3-dioxygenase-like lactoylglutathione lyase family enzyme|nr:VOC family protein [Rhodospirillaceae bacterium]MBT5945871.1 VOC family protein [Rhodospirillaceae bacterium]MBT6403149.1 VOC family protein [Rhodospirillaceae bacterium]MBT6534728.1 VOC family protein [Rhodospirillaceae bacterium]